MIKNTSFILKFFVLTILTGAIVVSTVFLLKVVTGSRALSFSDMTSSSDLVFSEVVAILVSLGMLIIMMKPLYDYLQGKNVDKQSPDKGYSHDFSQSDIVKLKSMIKSSDKSDYERFGISEDEKRNVLNNIQKNILQESTSNIMYEIESRFSEKYEESAHLESIRHTFDHALIRLKREIDALGRRANTSLVLGVATTLVAVFILASALFSGSSLNDINLLTKEEIALNYMPRLMLSLFIEVFSFFFLNLYKSSLGEIKFFQNEMTNLEIKFSAIEYSLKISNDKTDEIVISKLINTERNFKLRKGESTVELNARKQDNQDLQGLLSSILQVMTIKKN